jgi:3-methyladenine DNA glycosylase AlkC
MGLIKDIYSPKFYDAFSDVLKQTLPGFDKKKFVQSIFDGDFKNKEWKDRMKHTTKVLHVFMPKDFPKAVVIIEKTILALRKKGYSEGGLEFMFFPDYIETYGLNDFDTAARAFEFITPFISCEFAVRPFILKYGKKMVAQMVKWSVNKNAAVRRLASEGSRPRLPWAMAIPALKKDPTPVLPVLENLKNDPSESVRRSVANHLNDIAKDHPDIVLKIAEKWKGQNKETDAIVKHGCRTLLKQGDTQALKIYGLKSENISVTSLKVMTPVVKVGKNLEFGFTVKNTDKKTQTVRLEYGIYYKKAKGHLARKVFKISERAYAPGEKAEVSRKQPFKPITTRQFHTGAHRISIIVNGEEKAMGKFELK